MTKKLFVLILLTTLFVTGCECVGGFGRDLQQAGNWLEHKSGSN
jgi:predicted small secreted protein